MTRAASHFDRACAASCARRAAGAAHELARRRHAPTRSTCRPIATTSRAFLRQLPADEPVPFVGLGSNLLVRDGGLRGTVVVHAQRPARALAVARRHSIYAEAGVAEPEARALRGDARLRRRRVPGGHSRHRRRRAGDERRLLRRRDLEPRRARRGRRSRSGAFAMRTPARLRDRLSQRAARRRRAADGMLHRRVVPLSAGRRERRRARASRSCCAKRIATQPLGQPNAGSVFRNPPGDHAARLIEVVRPQGLRDRRRAGVARSTPTSSSIRGGSARAADIEALIAHVQRHGARQDRRRARARSAHRG